MEIIDSEEDEWGEIYDNGTGIGVMGNVLMDNADLGISALYSWYQAFRFLDFSSPYLRTGITCVAPAPKLLRGWHLPLLSFATRVWLVLIIMLPVCAIGLYLADLKDSWLIVAAIFLNQSIRDIWLTWRVRMVIALPLVGTLILGTAFSDGLESSLTIPKYEPPIDSVQDLVDHDIEWGATHDAWIFSILLSEQPNMKHLVRKFRELPAENLLALGLKGDFAFSVERLPAGNFAIGDYVTEDLSQILRLMTEDIYWEQCVAMLRKGSPYTRMFNRHVARLHSGGHILAWESQVVQKYSNFKVQQAVALSQSRQSLKISKLKMHHITGAIIALAIGCVLSAVVFLMEIVYSRVTNNRQKAVDEENMIN